MDKHPLAHLPGAGPLENRSEAQRSLDSWLATLARDGSLSGLRELLAKGANPKADDSEALAAAAANGHADCVELLIPISTPKALFSRALDRAASRGHADCARLLIPVSNPRARSSAALISAASNGFVECVKLLLPVSDPLARGSLALRSAIINNRPECVALLIPHSNAKGNRSGALRLAIHFRRVECAKLLVPASQDLSEDPLPAEHALRLGEEGIFSIMLAHNPRLADAVSLPDALDNAVSAGHFELAYFLKSAIESRFISEACSSGPAPSSPKFRL